MALAPFLAPDSLDRERTIGAVQRHEEASRATV